ncbi:hypothetical protein [Nocardia asiatica]|uniref:hypothetical protein n=1 Tax=Nocardia asiatica TaxID=209252 RepID=UPI003EE0FA3B
MAGDGERIAADIDLFELAQLIARHAGGMVSIEDAGSHVLAYSASDENADPLRVRSILGREGPREYLALLRQWGVFDRLRDTDEVVDVPAHDELNIKRRLVIGVRRPRTGTAARHRCSARSGCNRVSGRSNRTRPRSCAARRPSRAA